MQFIDPATWERRDHFDAYLGTDFPYINIGAHLDVTELVQHSREQGLSSYLTLVFLAHQTAHEIVNFRYRILEDKPVLVDRMALSFTHVPPDSDLFINVTVDPPDDLFRFQEEAKERIRRQGNDLGLRELRGRLDLIMYSVIPWVQYTHFVRTLVKAGVDSNPKISWGRYFEEDGRIKVPFSVQVHHGLVDGLHIGRYYEGLRERIAGLSRSGD